MTETVTVEVPVGEIVAQRLADLREQLAEANETAEWWQRKAEEQEARANRLLWARDRAEKALAELKAQAATEPSAVGAVA